MPLGASESLCTPLWGDYLHYSAPWGEEGGASRLLSLLLLLARLRRAAQSAASSRTSLPPFLPLVLSA
jgi:hypothetical protein